MKTSELSVLGFPPSLIKILQDSGFVELLPIQAEAISDYSLLDNTSGNLLIVAPTSSGKTFVGELAALNEALGMRRAFFLVPFRAIAEEMYADLVAKYEEYGLRIAISDSDHREHDEEILSGDFDIAVVVYEKLSGLLVAQPSLLDSCGLVVADEIQMIMDRGRGPSIELLLTRVLSTEGLRIVGLSAVLDKLNDFDKWLSARVLRSTERPVELRESVYSTDGTVEYHEFNSHRSGADRLAAWSTEEEGLVRLINAVDAAKEQALVFCATKASTLSIARKIAASASTRRAATETIRQSADLPDTPEKENIQNLMHSGVAYHNSDLSLEERLLIEDGFRRRNIKILAGTSTLSMGVNLPSRNVIIYGTTKWDGARSIPITVSDYKNMAGRAGRYSAGDEYGSSFLLASSQSARDLFLSNYVLGSLEGFSSAFGDQVIDMQVLQIVAGGLAADTPSVSEFIFQTYNGRFKWRTDQSKKAIQQMIIEGLEHCVETGAVQQSADGKLSVTPDGRLCAASGFSLAHLEMAKSYLSQCSEVMEGSVIFWALKTDYECGVTAYHIARVRGTEYRAGYYQRLLLEAARKQRLGQPLDELSRCPQSITYDDAVVIKRSLACLCWVSEMATRKFLELFPGVTVGAIRNTSIVCARLVSFLSDLSALHSAEVGIQEALLELVARLSHGATRDALRLARIRRSGLSRDERNHLVRNGISSIEDLLNREIETIPLPISKASRLLAAIEDSISDDLERRRRSQKSRLSALGVNTSLLDALYRAQGKDLELAIDELLKPPFLSLVCRKVSHQNEGEPDHVIYTKSQQAIVVQTTARERKLVTMTKATSVIGQSSKYKPVGYIVFGRPDFDGLSIRDSEHQVSSGINYKLIPISTLGEMFVLFNEKRLSSGSVEAVLTKETGYLGKNQLYEILKKLESAK